MFEGGPTLSKFTKMSIVGGVYVLIVLGLLASAFVSVESDALRRVILRGGGSGFFVMYGMAFLGLSVLASVIVLGISRVCDNDNTHS
jgi:Zn-dependent protease with chaperone function